MKETDVLPHLIVGTNASCRHAGLSRTAYYRNRCPVIVRRTLRRGIILDLPEAKRADIQLTESRAVQEPISTLDLDVATR